MQDKIIVTPSEVRGLGNIVSEKELEDFLVYMSTITSTSEEVDGITRKVYALGYVPPQVSLTLTLEKTVLDYDEHTNLIATLLDENNVGIPNEEVKFYNENSYLFYTGTTDSNGVITINVYSHQPGQHTYTGVLTSDTSVTGSVNVTINKITSTISLSASSSTITYGSSVTLSGTLSAGSNKSVKIYNGSSLVDTVTSGSGGAFSKSVSGLSVGTHSFTAVFEGDSTYTNVTSTALSVTVQSAPSFDGISLSSSKDILSYVDGESATLTAQLMDGQSAAAVSGQTVTFEVRKSSDDSLVETLTDDTDSSGIATVSYLGIGAGDIYIKAECRLLIQTYGIIDAKFYASNSRIESEGVDYNHQRLIFVSDYEVSYDDVIHFRFGNTVPDTVGLGISSKSYSNDVFIEKTGSTTKLYRNVYSQATLDNPFVANHDFCMKPVADSPNDQCWLYDNDTYINWYNFKLTNKRVRVDKYYSYPFTIEIIVL